MVRAVILFCQASRTLHLWTLAYLGLTQILCGRPPDQKQTAAFPKYPSPSRATHSLFRNADDLQAADT